VILTSCASWLSATSSAAWTLFPPSPKGEISQGWAVGRTKCGASRWAGHPSPPLLSLQFLFGRGDSGARGRPTLVAANPCHRRCWALTSFVGIAELNLCWPRRPNSLSILSPPSMRLVPAPLYFCLGALCIREIVVCRAGPLPSGGGPRGVT